MGRKANYPLTPEEAKWRFRVAASEFRLTRVARRHPLESLIASALLGFAVAKNGPLSQKVLRLIPTLLRHSLY